jgi:hypothetical protein
VGYKRTDLKVLAFGGMLQGEAGAQVAEGDDVGGIAGKVVEVVRTWGELAVIFEELQERDDVRHAPTKMPVEVVDAGGVGAEAGEDGSAARVAERYLAISAVEAHVGRDQPVEVRSGGDAIAGRVENVTEVVDGDAEDIGARLRCGEKGKGRGRSASRGAATPR